MLNSQFITLRGAIPYFGGLVALSDMQAIKRRTALTGGASLWDSLVLAPGIRTQQTAPDVNDGEFPKTAAMTSGYIFRIENEAVVSYLQSVGEPGCLVTVRVDGRPKGHRAALLSMVQLEDIIVSIIYFSAIACTLFALAKLHAIQDYQAVGAVALLIISRFINTVVIKRRTQGEDVWRGAEEPGVAADLLVLLSQDRWIRMRGLVDDMKMVTAGQWLRKQTAIEGLASTFADLSLLLSSALTMTSTSEGSLIVTLLLLASAGILGLCNALTQDLHMVQRRIHVTSKKQYLRRLKMAEELIEEMHKDEWAIALGLIRAPFGQSTKAVV